MKEITIRDIAGVQFGHASDYVNGTGCSVIICEGGAVAGVDVRGGGPATRETDLLRPENMIERIHAVVLSGGSAFGLEASCGVMEYLERRGSGFDTGVAKVPLVCAASLFDLAVGSSKARPNKEMGIQACGQAASPSKDDKLEGNVGAGVGCSVGKLAGMEHATKSGIGMAGLDLDGLQVAVVVAVNAAGNVIDKDGSVLAGVRGDDGKPVKQEQFIFSPRKEFAQLASGNPVTNTTIGCVVTNAELTKAQAKKIASIAQDGLARAINPVHTSNDGDTIFVMGTGGLQVKNVVDAVGILSAELVEQAIRNAVKKAEAAFGLPAIN